MTAAATWAFTVLLGICAATAALIVATRIVRLLLERRRAHLAAEPRRRLLALAADGQESGELAVLVALPERSWRAVAPVAIGMLSKVRGEAHAALAAVFEGRGAVAREFRALSARTAVRRARAAEVLGGLRYANATPGLVALLRDRKREVRLVAIRALGRIGAPGAARPLLECLARVQDTPANLVTDALVRIGPAAAPALQDALVHAQPRVRLVALSALRLIGATGTGAVGAGAVGTEDLVVAALGADPSTEVRVAAAALLGRLGTASAVTPLCTATAEEQPVPVRVQACRALGELGAIAAVERLSDLLEDPDYAVAHAAAHALAALGAVGRVPLQAQDGRHSMAAAHAREALALAALAPGALVADAPVPDTPVPGVSTRDTPVPAVSTRDTSVPGVSTRDTSPAGESARDTPRAGGDRSP